MAAKVCCYSYKGLTFNRGLYYRFVQMTLTHPVKYLCIFLCIGLISCTEVQKKSEISQSVTADGTVTAALSSTSTLAAFSSTTSGIVVQDVTKATPSYRLSHQDPVANLVTLLNFSSDGQFLVSADLRNVGLWQLSDGKNLGFWSMQEGVTVRDIAVSAQGKHLVIAQNDGKIQHITLKTGRRLEFLGHTRDVNAIDHNVNSVAISPNGRYVLSGGNDYKSYLWDSETGQVLHSFTHPSRVTKVALDNQGRFLFSADSRQQAEIYDVRSGTKVSQLQIDRSMSFSAARFSDDGKWLITGSPAQQVVIWDVATGKPVHEWLVTPNPNSRPANALVYDVGFTAQGKPVTVSSVGLLEIWNP